MPGAPPFRSTRFNAWVTFWFSQTRPHSSALDFPSFCVGDCSALWSALGSFTSRLCPAVSLPGIFCLPGSSRVLLKVLVLPRCSALPISTAMVVWPLLTSAASIWFLNQGYRSRLDGRSPQVRALTFPAPSPHLLLWPLIALGFIVVSQLTRLRSLIWGLCSSSRRFASGFLQTPPHGDALAFR